MKTRKNRTKKELHNLTAIIDMNELIIRTGGNTHTMEFRIQKKREADSDNK